MWASDENIPYDNYLTVDQWWSYTEVRPNPLKSKGLYFLVCEAITGKVFYCRYEGGHFVDMAKQIRRAAFYKPTLAPPDLENTLMPKGAGDDYVEKEIEKKKSWQEIARDLSEDRLAAIAEAAEETARQRDEDHQHTRGVSRPDQQDQLHKGSV